LQRLDRILGARVAVLMSAVIVAESWSFLSFWRRRRPQIQSYFNCDTKLCCTLSIGSQALLLFDTGTGARSSQLACAFNQWREGRCILPQAKQASTVFFHISCILAHDVDTASFCGAIIPTKSTRGGARADFSPSIPPDCVIFER